jgi:hypothetical protein
MTRADVARHIATKVAVADSGRRKTRRIGMGIDETDLMIYPYTVGREDCRVLPRSFRTLAEAEAYLAAQDKVALERGEFYLDGPEQDATPSNCPDTSLANPETAVAAPAAPVRAEVQSERTRTPFKPKATGITWTRDVEELCRSLEEE